MELFLLGQSVTSLALRSYRPVPSPFCLFGCKAGRGCACMSVHVNHRLPPVHLDSCHVTVTISGKPTTAVQ